MENYILQALLSFIAGCVYMMRGGSPCFQLFSKPFGLINPENNLYKTPRWVSVAAQLLIIAPWVYVLNLDWWLIAVYPLGWYLTIATAWGSIMRCDTWSKRFKFFLRMSESFIFFAPLAYAAHPNWYFIPAALLFTVAFSVCAVANYTFYGRETDQTDLSFDWAEFLTGMLLAWFGFSLLQG